MITPKDLINKLRWQYQLIKSIPFKQKLKQRALSQWQGETLTEEQREVIDYLKNHPIETYPYEFVNNYPPNKIKVFKEKRNGLSYVLHRGHKLYFKRGWGDDRIRRAYAMLCCEQHPGSPHCYNSPDFEVPLGGIIADVGSAEGIFSLNHIDNAAHIYLFEADSYWREALEATFAPWREKVTIIHRFVSDKNTETEITLDTYFVGKNLHFIKADIEGAERTMLTGSVNLLQRAEMRQIAITTYHRPDDATVLRQILDKEWFTTRYTHGYMLFTGFGMPEPPYLRRGVIQASK